MEIFRELDAWPEIARCQAGIGWIAVTGGDFALAADSLAESLRLNQACGQRLGIARGLEAFAALAAARQQPEQAARLAGAACQLRESLGHGAGIGPQDRRGARLRPRPARRVGRRRLVRRGTRADGGRRRQLRARLGPDADGNPGARQPAWTDPARLGPVGGSGRSGPRQDGGHRAASPLTPREHEIVLLIAQGLSNRKIADELVISPATAARHVANILAKLGFTSRTQVASWATRHEPPALTSTCTCARGAGTAAGQYAHRNTQFGACAAGRRVIAFNCR